MKKAALLLSSLLIVLHVSAAGIMPKELVGYWRNSLTSTNYDEIGIAPDGTGYLQGALNGDEKFYDTKLVYNSTKHVLTINARGRGDNNDGKEHISQFSYNPSSKTLVNLNQGWGGKRPFKRPGKFLILESTLSPGRRYGVTVPVYNFDDNNDPPNNLVEIKTGRVLTTINAQTGYDRALNFLKVGPTRWSKDSSILLWEVQGKWMDEALVLIKIKDGKVSWQLDLLKTAQKAILDRTKAAAPKTYLAVKGDGSQYGSGYPDGFVVDVTVPDAIQFPLVVYADLTANPKEIENYPNNLDSQLDGVVDENGKFTVTKFALTARKNRFQ